MRKIYQVFDKLTEKKVGFCLQSRMRKIYQVFDKLTEKKVGFCLQSRGENNYYNLSIVDRFQNHHSFSADNIDSIEEQVLLMWGDLIDDFDIAIIPAPSIPKPAGMPLPPGR